MAHFISKRKGLSVFSFNCQSLHSLFDDLYDQVTQRANILIPSETWLENEQEHIIPNFNCIVKYIPPNVRGGGVAIYHNTNDRSNVVTPHMEINIRELTSLSINVSPVGELCAAKCRSENGRKILIMAIHMCVNQTITDIINFIHKQLLAYTPLDLAVLRKNYDKMPMILSGDFNVHLANNDSVPLVDFLRENLQLKMNNNPNEPTRYGTTIDPTFQRYLDTLESRSPFTYFS